MATLLKSRKHAAGFTVVDNRVLMDRELSLKAVGMLVRLLSLPEGWRFSIRGLASLGTDGKDSVQSALKELEAAGYLVRGQRRSESGTFAETVYIAFDERMDVAEAVAELAEQGCMVFRGDPALAEAASKRPPEDGSKEASTKPLVATDGGFSGYGSPVSGSSTTIKYVSNSGNKNDVRTTPAPTPEDAAERITAAARERGIDVPDPRAVAERFCAYNDARGWSLPPGFTGWRDLADRWVEREGELSGKGKRHAGVAAETGNDGGSECGFVTVEQLVERGVLRSTALAG